MRSGTFRALLAVALAAAGACTWAATLTDAQILQAADRARGNLPGASWRVDIDSDAEQVRFDVQVRNNDFFAEYLAPPRQKGDRLLMVGGNMWFYKPGLSKPVPISQRQKLSGMAAYGDISGTNYADDYESQREPDEVRGGEPCYVFVLKSKKGRATTYDRVRAWVSQARLVNVRAEYFTVSGKLFKSVELDHELRLRVDGELMPFVSQARFVDELGGGGTTVMHVSQPQIRTADPARFDAGFLAQ